VRILFVSPFVPYPPAAGGHAMVWSWLRRLAPRHTVAFVGFCEREGEEAGAEELARHCVAVRVRLRRPEPHGYASIAQTPRWVAEFYSREVAADVQAVARSVRPEVVLFLSTNMAQYRRFVGAVPWVVTALDISFVVHRRLIPATSGLARLRARAEWARMLRYEVALFRRAQRVIAVSEHDARIIRRVAAEAAVTAVPPGADLDRYDSGGRRPEPGTVLFVGHMEHFPNLDALIHLCRDIWPRVRARAAGARLIVAGREAREQLGRAAPQVLAAVERDRSIELRGWAPDLGELMARSAALAAPVRLGAGVRTKVIEAMAAGLPVVTTPRGAEGLEAIPGRELLVADGRDRFAEELVRLLGDEALQRRLSQAGRARAARDHDNERLAKRLEGVLAAVAGGKR